MYWWFTTQLVGFPWAVFFCLTGITKVTYSEQGIQVVLFLEEVTIVYTIIGIQAVLAFLLVLCFVRSLKRYQIWFRLAVVFLSPVGMVTATLYFRETLVLSVLVIVGVDIVLWFMLLLLMAMEHDYKEYVA